MIVAAIGAHFRIHACVFCFRPKVSARDHQLKLAQPGYIEYLRKIDANGNISQANERGVFIEVIFLPDIRGVNSPVEGSPCARFAIDGNWLFIVGVDSIAIHPLLGFVVQVTTLQPIKLNGKSQKFSERKITNERHQEIWIGRTKAVSVGTEKRLPGCFINHPPIAGYLIIRLKRVCNERFAFLVFLI